MKKLSFIIALLLIVTLFVGCGDKTDTTPTDTISTKQRISDEVITEAMLSFRYPAGGFSIPLEDLLPKCCPDYKGTFASYEELKNDKLSEETIQKYESSNIKEYLDNSYFVTLTGCIMENPEIPYLVTENKEILTLLIIFDDNDNMAGTILVNSCSQLETCAILIATSSY